MIVAVTGGTGFIGRELVRRHLAQGDSVRVLTRRPRSGEGVEWIAGDLAAQAPDLRPFVDGVDILYHCAGEVRDPARMQALHVDGTQRLIDAARGRIGRWVQLSSVGAYGLRRSGEVTEETPTAPSGPYETTKTEADARVVEAATAGAFRCTILRPSNVIGAAMTNRSVFQLIGAIARGLFVFIGPPGAQTNYVHVGNVAQAAMACGRRSSEIAETFIVSDGCTFEHFVERVASGLGRPAPRRRVPEWLARQAANGLGWLKGFPLTPQRVDALTGRAVYSDAKLRRMLGYFPEVTIDAAIDELVSTWRSNVRA
jgi:nucleoside-diphosphate-sugar epimerase